MKYNLNLNTDNMFHRNKHEANKNTTIEDALKGISEKVNNNLKEIYDETNPNIKDGIGLVFEGGGGKGAYEIGVWQALEELGIAKRITGVSGTSVGALNAALFANGSLDEAIRAWSNISNDAILTKSRVLDMIPSAASSVAFSNLFLEGGIFNHDGLTNLMTKYLNPKNIVRFKRPVYATCAEVVTDSKPVTMVKRDYMIETFYPTFMPYNTVETPEVSFIAETFDIRLASEVDMINILLASAAIPVAFPKVEVYGKEYVDGGMIPSENLPVKPLYNYGFRDIITVRLNSSIKLYGSDYPNARITEIMPSEDLGGIFSGTMNFDAEKAKRLMALGRRDALKVLKNRF